MPRRRTLTAAQARELIELYRLGRTLRTKALAIRFGIAETTLQNYVRRAHAPQRQRYTTDELVRELTHE